MNKRLLFSIFLTYITTNAQLNFKDSAVELGVNLSYGSGTYAGGVSFLDYNQDGWDDLTIGTQINEDIQYYKNVNGTFVKDNLNIPENLGEHKQILWIDFDNDGDKDLFVTVESGDTKLYENEGNSNFTDITSTSGISHTGKSSWGASWGDYNNDGYLDIYINFLATGNTQPNRLFRNNGNKTFTDVTTNSGLNSNIDAAFCSAFFDYNNDGWQDLYVTNHKYQFSYLYKNNQDGTFSDVSAETNANVSADGMSTTIGDYNADGFFDIYITNSAAGNIHLRNNGGNSFTNVAEAIGTVFNSVSWGAVFLDADCDGALDLYVSGMGDGSNGKLPSAFYKNNGLGTYEIPGNIGLQNDRSASFSNAIGDVNNDGLPDIYVVNQIDNNFLWKNETVNTSNWLKIKLKGTESNKDGIGNKIEIITKGESQFRYTLCGEGYLAQNSEYEFFGIGDNTIIDQVNITWNKTGVTETLSNITPNQSIVVEEGKGVLGVESIEAQQKFSVYPNPSNSKFTVASKQSVENIKVFDLIGREVYSSENSSEIDLINEPNGIYIAKIVLEGNTTKKIKLIKN